MLNLPAKDPATLDEALEQIRLFREELEHSWAKLRLYGDGKPGSFSRSFLQVPRTVMETLDPLLWVDCESRIVDVNSRMCALLFDGRDRAPAPHELKGRPLAEIDRLPWAHGVLATLLGDARRQGFPADFAAQRRDPSGRTFHYVFHAESTPKGGHFRVEDVSSKVRIEEYFSRYVGAEVMEMLKQRTEEDFFRTSRYRMSVVFADLRGFTRASSTLAPEQVCEFINEFLEAMIEVVDRCRATVDKIVGDEVMVLCGAPVHTPDHAALALRVAIGMVEAQYGLLLRWRQSPVVELHDLQVGVGIHTGEMVVGNIGTRRRSDYTVLGANVNLAARLCSQAGGGQILMSRETFDAVRDVIRRDPAYFDPPLKGFREHPAITAKGFAEPIPVVLYTHQPTLRG
ncbi:MAG: adenylate/guanylate cyclase domain-containing protein [Candidatus Wallbacteria bacterium]|nr:adenylate/guanylate cyclase domain-containing protein [Candidatus Wallbacteria bacterium]